MILNLYPYGSRVYGVADDQSDTDLIIITDDGGLPEVQYSLPGIDVTTWTAAEFQRLLDEHDPSALECYFLPTGSASCSREFGFELDIEKLRRSFSAKSSNSWVKAKKKIEVHSEWRIGLKSLFHSLRLLDFGTQIATQGRIADYSSANKWWQDIGHQWEDLSFWGDPRWEHFKTRWQPIYNRMRSEFRIAAPIDKGKEP